jgi:hypothetical protein
LRRESNASMWSKLPMTTSLPLRASMPGITFPRMAFRLFQHSRGAHRQGRSCPAGISERESKIKKEQNMSDFPIQTTSLDELAGGQRPLTPSPDRRGNEFPQSFPLTGRPGTEVNNDQPARTVSPNTANGAGSRPPESVSGLNAGAGRAIAVKNRWLQNDFRQHSGRSQSTVARLREIIVASGSGRTSGPRSSTGQFPNGRADTAGKGGSFGNQHANESYPTPDDGD